MLRRASPARVRVAQRAVLGLVALIALAGLVGCPGSNAGTGESCGGNDDCNSALQCLKSRCVPRCTRAPECGDGYACDDDGLCQLATGQPGEHCRSEVDCAAGLSCQIDGATKGDDGFLQASCTAEHAARAAGGECAADTDCRNGTCAMGHCTDLCREDRDCGTDTSCMRVPQPTANDGQFTGCLPTQGKITWTIPVLTPSAEVLLPMPEATRSAELVMTVDDPNQRVGAARVLSPARTGTRLYTAPCSPPGGLGGLGGAPCTVTEALDSYYANPIRHLPAPVESVLLIPSGPVPALEIGTYRVQVSSFRPDGSTGTAIPRVTAVVRLDTESPSTQRILDLHFFFLDLEDHPCAALAAQPEPPPGGDRAVDTSSILPGTYLAALRTAFFHANITIGNVTLETIAGRPELDTLDTQKLEDIGTLLALGKYDTGINVFFVRSLSPIGMQAYAPNPGPAGLGGTRRSGIVIGFDTLCYRDWAAVARLTAHEIARYMGLYHNVERETPLHPGWRDPLDDGDTGSTNLMYFSELAGPGGMPSGSDLTAAQADMLRRSAVLR